MDGDPLNATGHRWYVVHTKPRQELLAAGLLESTHAVAVYLPQVRQPHVPARRWTTLFPGYLFLHGLGAGRFGEKGDSLLRHAQATGRAFARYDARGHGDSTGTLGRVTVGELIADAVAVLERRNTITVSVTERQLYLELNGSMFSTVVHEHPLA